MRNSIQPGDTLTIPAPADVLSGGVVIAGNLKGIAATDAASGAPVAVGVRGVFDLPKAAVAFTLGSAVYWTGTAATTVS
jgi:predicted RecA/RadA family phage recombinase